QIPKLATDDLVALTTSQWQGITNFAALRAFTSDQLGKMTSDTLRALTTDQWLFFTPAQLQGITSDKFGGWTTDVIMTHTSNRKTPLVLDLNGDGIKTQSVDKGVVFDLAATGTPVQAGWVSRQDGFLVRDLNGDRKINDGSELFGQGTTLANGQKAKDGYEALAELDANKDGVIDAKDPGFATLKVWQDKNSDGVSQQKEIKPLSAYGITRLDVTPEVTQIVDKGNLIGLVSKYDTKAGNTLDMADVWFETRPADTLRSNVANLANTLTTYQAAAVEQAAGYASGGFDLADKLSVVDKHDSVGTVVNDLVDNLKHYNANGIPMNHTTVMTAVKPLNGADALLSDKKDKGGILGSTNS
ncbi:MAG: hypothetical protein ACR2HF_16045, partial [Methylococcaceae bacterium]